MFASAALYCDANRPLTSGAALKPFNAETSRSIRQGRAPPLELHP